MANVFLRTLIHEDVNEEYLSWFVDDAVTNFLEVDGKTLSVEKVKQYIDEGFRSKQYFMYAICDKQSGRHIGNLKVGPINYKHGISDLVCVIGDRSYWGRGLATEAISIGNQIAFKEFNIRKLHGQIYADNIGSIKAYCKAGWIIEGVIKNRYWVNGKQMDQVLVSCNNPAYDDPAQTDYNIRELQRLIEFRKSFVNKT